MLPRREALGQGRTPVLLGQGQGELYYSFFQNNVPFQSLKAAVEFPSESILGKFEPAFLAPYGLKATFFVDFFQAIEPR